MNILSFCDFTWFDSIFQLYFLTRVSLEVPGNTWKKINLNTCIHSYLCFLNKEKKPLLETFTIGN